MPRHRCCLGAANSPDVPQRPALNRQTGRRMVIELRLLGGAGINPGPKRRAGGIEHTLALLPGHFSTFDC